MAKRNWQATFEAPAPDTHPTARLAKIARLPLGESEAELLWREASRHRRELLRRLGRDVGQRVAVLDFLTNMKPRLAGAAAIDAAALSAIERLVMSDALTGLYDRAYFEHALKREVQRCHRTGAASSLLLLDLDDFREMN